MNKEGANASGGEDSIASEMIMESELADFMKNKAVKKFNVSQNEDATFRLFINLTWKEGDLCLGTVRKKPRDFVSLDTLIGFMQKLGVTRPFTVSLYNRRNT